MRKQRKIFKIIFFLFCISVGFNAFAGIIDSSYNLTPHEKKVEKLHYDYSKNNFCNCEDNQLAAPVDSRSIKTDVLEKHRKEKDFLYDRTIKDEANSFWDGFWSWLQRKLFGKLTLENAIRTRNIVYWAIGIFAVIIVSYWLYKSEFFGAPLRRSAKISDALFNETERSEEDIEAQINEAIKSANYPLAIRWVYIKSIKSLASKNELEIRQDKTNYDYYLELRNKDLRDLFYQLTQLFEFTNYGKFTTNLNHYHEAATIFNHLNTKA